MKTKILTILLLAASVAWGAETNSPVCIPMHWGVIRGAPYVPGETNATYTVATKVALNQKYIALSSASGLYQNQLIAYTPSAATRKDYYTNVIDTISGDTVYTLYPMEDTITAGNNVFSFYDNPSHPSNPGMYAIIDYTFRYLSTGNRVGDVRRIIDIYGDNLYDIDTVGAPAITKDSVNSIFNPGSLEHPSINAVCDAGEGICTTQTVAHGMYSYDISLNPGDSLDTVLINFLSNDSIVKTVTVASIGSAVQWLSGDFETVATGTITVKITAKNASTFKVGCIRVLYKVNTANNINHDDHVIIGDSWSAYSAFRASIITHCPSAATVTNKGISGSTAASIYPKFDSLMQGLTPEYIWLMVGTNDYWGGNPIGVDSFNISLQMLLNKCRAIGAKVIVFDPSVGPKTYNLYDEWELTNRSHEYALVGQYNNDWGTIAGNYTSQLPIDSLEWVISSAMLGKGNWGTIQTSGVLPMWSRSGTQFDTLKNMTAGYGHQYDSVQRLWVTKSDLTDDFISLGQNGFASYNKFTLFMWLKSANVTAAGSSLLVRQYDSQNRVLLQMNGSGNVVAEVVNLATGTGSFPTTSKISNNTPFCLCLKYDKNGATNADREKVYVNGVPVVLSMSGTISSTGTFGFTTQTLMLIRAAGVSASTIMLYKNLAKSNAEIYDISTKGPLFKCKMVGDTVGTATIVKIQPTGNNKPSIGLDLGL